MTREAAAQPMRALNRDGPIAWALVALVFVAGSWIPLPGLRPDTYAAWAEATPTGRGWSILLLGFEPILSALLVFELMKLVVPRFLRWSSEACGGFVEPRTLIAALALLIAAHRAIQYHDAFVMVDFASADGLSGLLVVATLVAGVATLLFLAERVEVPGLALGGLWLIGSVVWIEDLALWAIDLIEQVRVGRIDDRAFAFPVVLAVAAVAATVFSATVLRRDVEASGGDPLRWSALLIWPPVLTESLVNALAGWTADRLPDQPTGTPSLVSAVWVVCFCLFLPVVMGLYARSIREIDRRGAVRRGRSAILTLLALVQIAICSVFQLLSETMLAEFTSTVPIRGTTLIVVVVVMSAAFRVGRDAAVHGPPRAKRR